MNPLELLERTIGGRLKESLGLKPIFLPDDVDINQPPNQALSISWDRLANFQPSANVYDPVSGSAFIYSTEAIYNVTLQYKDLKLKNNAKSAIYDIVILLTGFQSYHEFSPLFPVNAGYVGYDAATGYIKHACSFSTSFNWKQGKGLTLTDVIPIAEFSDYEIDLKLWNSTGQTNITNGVLV